MKRFSIQLLLIILFSGIAFSVFADGNAEQRVWKSVTGRPVLTGSFDKFKPTDPNLVYIRSSNGKLFQYPFDKLSKEDQEYIRSLDDVDSDLVEVEEVPEDNNKKSYNARGNDSSDAKPEFTGRRFALLVGVNHYLDLNQLECPVADMKLIQEKLLQLGFEPDDIRMYVTGNMIGKYPDKKTVEAGFHEILEEADENSQIFIAFAGHGFELDDDKGGKDKISYFAVEDTKAESQDELKKTAINVSAMVEELSKCKASSKWIIVDACREYMIPKRSSNLTKISRGINSIRGNLPEGVFFLQSCGSSESSYEYDGNGLFTRCFADALDGKADSNNDGDLTVLEVFDYVSTNVKKDALKILSKRQTPTYSGIKNAQNFTIASTSNLLHFGLPQKDWDKIQKLYDECEILYNNDKNVECLEKLNQASTLMRDADDDAPLKRRVLVMTKQVRESLDDKKKVERDFEKEKEMFRAQLELEKENAILKAKLEAEQERKALEAQKAKEQPAVKTVVVREQPQRPVYRAPTQFVYLGAVQSVRGDNSEARMIAAQYGYRLPSPSELAQISRNDISGIPLDGWIETSDPNVVCAINFQRLVPSNKRGAGRNWVVGCR